jgi:hypothetical protein
MVTGIVGPSAILFYDNPLRIPRAAAYFRIHIVLAIVARGKLTLAIPKPPAADISRQSLALMSLNCLEQVFGFLRGVLLDAMRLSIERRRGIGKSWSYWQNGWDRERRYGRFRR